MVEWSPRLRYSVEELVDGLQLEMSPPSGPSARAPATHEATSDGDPISIARPKENAVLADPRTRGLYKVPLDTGGQTDRSNLARNVIMKDEPTIVTIESITEAYRRLESHANAFELLLQRLDVMTKEVEANAGEVGLLTDALPDKQIVH